MVRKKLDNRIRTLIENCVHDRHRSFFVLVGDRGKDQVVILHHMLSKSMVKTRPSVLWCYKKELGFSSHRKKRMRQLQKKVRSGKLDVNEDDPFELFIASTNIRYCYYSETHKILGNTYGMCVLQDFEALSPNLLARTIETVEGGGIVVLLLRTMKSLKQLYTLTMDVHSRFRTEAHQDVVGRFNERFILSLAACDSCLVIDDCLNVLPVLSRTFQPVDKANASDKASDQLIQLKESLQDTQPIGSIVNCCKTVDQAKAVLTFIDAVSEKSLRNTVVLTAARGRGKSAALGLAMSSAVTFGYSNIYVTSPSPENLKTLFEFVFKGFDALGYQEHSDYELIESTNPAFNKAIVRVNIFKEHRQTIQYIHPSDAHKLGQAELLVIDEAAAIPLPLVRALLGPYLVFMASTINGYEGTGRSLSLKLIEQLRVQSGGQSATGRILHELSLSESIRYANADPVERWLNGLLCLDASVVDRVTSGSPVPSDCDLYYVNRDTLFSYHEASEAFLQRVVSLFVASHYKNTPNDLQLLSDAPAHHLFVLLGPINPNSASLPEILCVLQVCLEGQIVKKSVMQGLRRGQRASGDLIPWTVSQQFLDHDFPTLSGARVVRIAVHPDYQSMGYGSRALQLLQNYYELRVPNLAEDDDAVEETVNEIKDDEELGLLEERLQPRDNLKPLLQKLSERAAEPLQYLGVSYGLTSPLLKFWKRAGYVPVYLRQTANDLTGEHSCIMLKVLENEDFSQTWLPAFWDDFRRRFISLLSFQFKSFAPSTALAILQHKTMPKNVTELTRAELHQHLLQYDLKRLELYSENMADYHLVTDLLPSLARLYFQGRLNTSLSALQSGLLLGLGLQHKTVDDLAKEIDLPASQLLGVFNKTVRKLSKTLCGIEEQAVGLEVIEQPELRMEATKQTLEEDLNEAAAEVNRAQKAEKESLLNGDLSQYAVAGAEDDWRAAEEQIRKGSSSIISLKSSSTEKSQRKRKTDFSDKKKSKAKKLHAK